MAFEIRDRNPAGAWLGEGPLWLPGHRAFLWLDMPRRTRCTASIPVAAKIG